MKFAFTKIESYRTMTFCPISSVDRALVQEPSTHLTLSFDHLKLPLLDFVAV